MRTFGSVVAFCPVCAGQLEVPVEIDFLQAHGRHVNVQLSSQNIEHVCEGESR